MSNANERLAAWLFETNAVRVCPENRPFWYTSGTIGPYYINTHFLYGSEEKANVLLSLIDASKGEVYSCPSKVLEATLGNYASDAVYKGLIDEMCRFIKENIDLNEVDYISGGERRDWFFSLIIAELLEKPHITIYKDLTSVICRGGESKKACGLSGKKVLHIADLITEASSYERAWIPAISNAGGEMKWSVVVVDRKQGGEAVLSGHGVKSFAMVGIDRPLFEKVIAMGLINIEQYNMIIEYIADPAGFVDEFFRQHPEFLENALNSDSKTRERAMLYMQKRK
ncbi:hypothetical protein DFR58_13018 [Anaerobacterium chartisolvens]|uniref:Orotate phosphoribosyltransferase n=1 Tax=Anaerobacterium chartisolvens TaxID=1297424 RepID=A0A369ALU8_9FIRM|nr:orotate phosphoribosyltransferase [Anaerobacterium chartisolvens]RCX10352.1 hypothetical protein DFR58_13018 [Anaerobacterium chartisolvens]